MFRRILVPLDGTPESNAALPVARTMARATGASVSLLQVLEAAGPEAAANEAAARLRQVAGELAKGGVQAESAVRRGRAADEILHQVQALAADLVVMRTRGQAGIQRAVMGSVAERLLTRSDVPIVMLRPGGRQMDRIANLLVPVDGSPGGAIALSRAVDLANATGARIHLVEVVVPLASQALDPSEYDPTWDEEALRGAQTYIAGMASRLGATGTAVDGEARLAADIAAGIVAAADERTSDLIVMSTHALTGLRRLVLGSVADAVVRASTCPVLLLHRRHHAD